jgi:GT2 family glycosyltransferase
MVPAEALRTRHKKVTGFCLHLSREVLDKVGLFDEHLKVTFEDDDICARAILAGFPVELSNIPVHHYISRCGAYDQSKLNLALMKFRHKYNIPAQIPHEQFNAWIEQNHKWSEDMKEV